jgi:hypothetical protein
MQATGPTVIITDRDFTILIYTRVARGPSMTPQPAGPTLSACGWHSALQLVIARAALSNKQ